MSWHQAFLKQLVWHHDAIRRVVGGLPPEALDWNTSTIRNSCVVLATHIAGSERFWMGDVLVGEPSGRDRDAEFRAEGTSAEGLIAGVDSVEAYSRSALERAPSGDTVLTIPGRSGTATAAWVLMHVLEHAAYHGGQMNLIAKAWRSIHE